MRLSTEQLQRLSERVFKVLKASGHVGFDYSTDETVEDRVFESIMDVLEDDAKTEDRLSREAERLVQQQSHIAKASGKSLDDLVDEVKSRLAKAKRVTLGDGPDRADTLAEKVFKAIWNVEGIDFFSDDNKVQNCIARSIHRFRHDDERMIDAVERLADRKTNEERYTAPWCLAYDRYLSEVKQKLAAVHSTSVEPKTASPL
ncbi:MAG: DUF507 family protein [Betaproteobacteria bacterium]|nr:DUF507 family protein [Betaproteobacteria bacterium]